MMAAVNDSPAMLAAVAPGDNIDSCQCQPYHTLEAISMTPRKRAPIAHPQRSPRSVCATLALRRCFKATDPNLLPIILILCSRSSDRQTKIGHMATSKAADGMPFATTKSDESPSSMSTGISTFVVMMAAPVATPIEGIVLPLPSTVV